MRGIESIARGKVGIEVGAKLSVAEDCASWGAVAIQERKESQ